MATSCFPKCLLNPLLASTVFLGSAVSAAPQAADRIFIGTIVTMDSSQPTAEAVAIADGRILAVGTVREVTKLKSATTVTTRLQRGALLPGFFESHAHFALLARYAVGADLSPEPQGKTRSVHDIQSALKRELAKRTGDTSGAVMGWQYDDSLLAEHRHPTRDDLDAVSKDKPIIIVHISGHMVVANSRALSLMGISAESEDPPGGRISRRPGSREPDGLLEEKSAYPMLKLLPRLTPDQQNRNFTEVANRLVKLGVTTATEHSATPTDIAALRAFAKSGLLPIDLAVLVNMEFGGRDLADVSKTYESGLRVAGAKILIDGSLQGYTGWLTNPYHREPEGKGSDFAGYPALDKERTQALVNDLFDRNMLFAAHVNGDAAIDRLLDAVAVARARYPQASIRPIAIHAQTMREDQLDRAKLLGVTPSFFVDHVYFWGDRHRDIFLGPERGARISPTFSAKTRNIVFTIHDDAPVVPPSPLRTVRSAVTRLTVSGKLLGPEQRINVSDALRAITLSAAYQHGEDSEKGSITVGKRADLVILGRNPLRAPSKSLADIEVRETVKDGKTVYLAK